MASDDRLRQSFGGTSAIVTGGSKGIGLATARRIFELGANVSILARDPAALDEAKRSLEKVRVRADQHLETHSCDCSNMSAVRPIVEEQVARAGVPDFLINCVGYAKPDYVHELKLEDYRHHMEVNFFGQLTPILALLPHFKAAGRGHIANVSSVLGFFGMMGYAAYCPSKYAIVGLVEALRNELEPFGITFSLLMPADVDTPGYAIENRTKPAECKEMSKRAKLMSAEAVAEEFVRGIAQHKFEITPGAAGSLRLLSRLVPGVVRNALDNDYRKARAALQGAGGGSRAILPPR